MTKKSDGNEVDMLTREDHTNLGFILDWYDLLGLAYHYIYLLATKYLYKIKVIIK